MQYRLAKVCVCLFVGIGVICGTGCGASDRTEVSGKVTLNGKPLENGDITFRPIPATSAALSSTLIKDGEYRIGGEWALAPGTYQVQINGYRPSSDKSTMLAGGFLDRPPEREGLPRVEQFLPKQFNTATTIPNLIVPAGASSVEQNFDLKE